MLLLVALRSGGRRAAPAPGEFEPAPFQLVLLCMCPTPAIYQSVPHYYQYMSLRDEQFAPGAPPRAASRRMAAHGAATLCACMQTREQRRPAGVQGPVAAVHFRSLQGMRLPSAGRVRWRTPHAVGNIWRPYPVRRLLVKGNREPNPKRLCRAICTRHTADRTAACAAGSRAVSRRAAAPVRRFGAAYEAKTLEYHVELMCGIRVMEGHFPNSRPPPALAPASQVVQAWRLAAGQPRPPTLRTSASRPRPSLGLAPAGPRNR